MARNTSKNAAMQQHPEMVKAGAKARPVRRAVAGGGSSNPDRHQYFEMVSSPAGGGEVIARAIHLNDKGVNDLPEDAVVVCVFRQYAKIQFGGPCKHVIFRRSELTPFDVSLYSDTQRGKDDKENGQHPENQAEVSADGEGTDGPEPAR